MSTDLLSMPEAKRLLNIDDDDTTNDAVLALYVSAVCKGEIGIRQRRRPSGRSRLGRRFLRSDAGLPIELVAGETKLGALPAVGCGHRDPAVWRLHCEEVSVG